MHSAPLFRTLLSTAVKRSVPASAPSVRSALRSGLFTYTRAVSLTTNTRAFASSPISRMSGTDGKKGVHNIEAKSDWDSAIQEKDTLMVLDCMATWCGPCKVIAPQVVKFSDTYPQARFYKVDVDQVPDLAQELGVRAMPTFLLFKNGEKVNEVVGANPKALEAAITANL